MRDDQGYHFNYEKISVRIAPDEDAVRCAENVPAMGVNVPPTGLDDPPTGQNVPSISSIAGTELETAGGNGLNCRQKWIVQLIETGENVSKSQVAEKFGVSDKTAKRDLAQLVSKRMIRYVRKPHPGHYVRMR